VSRALFNRPVYYRALSMFIGLFRRSLFKSRYFLSFFSFDMFGDDGAQGQMPKVEEMKVSRALFGLFPSYTDSPLPGSMYIHIYV